MNRVCVWKKRSPQAETERERNSGKTCSMATRRDINFCFAADLGRIATLTAKEKKTFSLYLSLLALSAFLGDKLFCSVGNSSK